MFQCMQIIFNFYHFLVELRSCNSAESFCMCNPIDRNKLLFIFLNTFKNIQYENKRAFRVDDMKIVCDLFLSVGKLLMDFKRILIEFFARPRATVTEKNENIFWLNSYRVSNRFSVNMFFFLSSSHWNCLND